MKSFTHVCLVLVTAATLAAFAAQAQAEAATSSTNKPAAAAKPKGKNYVGKINGVDNDAKTLTIALTNGTSQILHCTSDTRVFSKDRQPAQLADLTAGLSVFGREHQDESGNWVANTVNVGEPKPRKAHSAPPANPAPATK